MRHWPPHRSRHGRPRAGHPRRESDGRWSCVAAIARPGSARRPDVDCMIEMPSVRWGRRRALRNVVGLATVAISDPPASRSDTRTVEGAYRPDAIRRADQAQRMVAQEGILDKPIVGIDVSKEWLDVAIAGTAGVDRIANDAASVAVWLDRIGPGLVAFEPTGGYERVVRQVLRDRGTLFVRVHPNDVIAFRKSRGIRAKTDKIDAGLIAAFAAEELVRRGLRPTILGDDVLRALAARRRQLVDVLHAERCRLDLTSIPAVRQSLTLVIDALAASLEALEQALAAHVEANPPLAELARLLQSVRGIGPVTAITLIADLPELGCLNAKEIAALVGLAPHSRQSGKARYREHTGHGRPAVRRVLFNAARSAIRHASPMKTFYERLVVQNRRPGKVALGAVMRKLLVTANAIARDRQPWKLNHA